MSEEFISGGKKKRGDGPTLAEISRQLSEHLSTRETPRHFAFPDRVRWPRRRLFRDRQNHVPH